MSRREASSPPNPGPSSKRPRIAVSDDTTLSSETGQGDIRAPTRLDPEAEDVELASSSPSTTESLSGESELSHTETSEEGRKLVRTLTIRRRDRASTESYRSLLQKSIDQLSKFHLSDYTHADYTGASPFFDVPVKVNKTNQGSGNDKGENEKTLKNELSKSTDYSHFSNPDVDYAYALKPPKGDKPIKPLESLIMKTLEEYVGDRQAYGWVSDFLPVDLNLPMRRSPPRSSVQVLLIATELTPFVLIVYDGDNTDPEDVRLFTMELARHLTWRLLDFCHLDIMLLPCTLTWNNFDNEALREEVDKQFEESFRFFGGIVKLTEENLVTLRDAVRAVADASYIPGLYLGDTKKMWLLQLEADWRDVLSGILEMLQRGDISNHLTYTDDTEFKLKVAVMEAARRLSFLDTVVITTPDDHIKNVTGTVSTKTYEELKLRLRLSAQSPLSNTEDPPPAAFLIEVDCPEETPAPAKTEVYNWSALEEALNSRDWATVADVILHTGNDAQRKWALKEAAAQAPENVILQFIQQVRESKEVEQADSEVQGARHGFPDDDADVILLTVVKRRLWNAALEILTYYKVSDLHRRYAVAEASFRAPAELFAHILRYRDNDQITTFLAEAVRQNMWGKVSEMLKGTEVPEEQLQWVADEASARAGGEELLSILHCCPDSRLDAVLSAVRERGQWRAVGYLLTRRVSEDERRVAVHQAREHASADELASILPHCSDDQLDWVVPAAVSRGMWGAVGQLLKRNVRDVLRKFAVEESLRRATRDELANILPYCTDEQLDSATSSAVTLGLWTTVGQLLQRGVDGSRWRFPETFYIDELQYESFQSKVSESVRRLAVEEAMKRASVDELSDILPYSADDQLDTALSRSVDCDLWDAVSRILRRKLWSAWRNLAREQKQECGRRGWRELIPDMDDTKFPFKMLLSLHEEILSRLLKEMIEVRDRFIVEDADLEQDRHSLVMKFIIHKEYFATTGKQLRQVLLKALNNEVSDSRQKWAVLEASQRATDDQLSFMIVHFCTDDVLGTVLERAVTRGLWRSVAMLLNFDLPVKQQVWVVQKASENFNDDTNFAAWFNSIDVASVLANLPFLARHDCARQILTIRFDREQSLCQKIWLWSQLFVKLLEREEYVRQEMAEYDVQTRFSLCQDIIMDFVSFVVNSAEKNIDLDQLELKWNEIKTFLDEVKIRNNMLVFDIFKEIKRAFRADLGDELIRNCVVMPLLAAQDIHVDFRALAAAQLKITWEDTRRFLLKTAAAYEDWDLVQQLADHSLYDDQRTWLINTALERKMWDMAVQLADHGLTQQQRESVHTQVATHADWDSVVQIFDHGADIETVIQHVGEAKADSENLNKLKVLELELSRDDHDFPAAVQECRWSIVFYHLHRSPNRHQLSLAVTAALGAGAAHVLIHLMRLGSDADKRDSLFPVAIRQQQWGVARGLLEQGVDAGLCRAALTTLIDAKQWILVARVMELSLDDTERHEVIQAAIDNIEGSLVAHYLSVTGVRLTTEDREWMFEQSFQKRLWPPLVLLSQEKDSAGARHRDMTCRSAVDHDRWDVVQVCITHGADVDMQGEDGQTMIQTAAREGRLDTVVKLLLHGATPPDTDKHWIMNRLTEAAYQSEEYITIGKKYRKAVKKLIEYKADINLPDSQDETPLTRMIDHYRSDPIKHCLLWGHDVSHAVDLTGLTTLPIMCLTNDWDAVRTFIARGSNLLAVNNRNETALSLVVKYRGKESLAECIRLGLSTHQPAVSDRQRSYDDSPMYHAIRRTDYDKMRMLYESGACSNKELHHLLNLNADSLQPIYMFHNRSPTALESLKVAFRYLQQLASTPRSLKSMCRLVISHCLGFHREKKKPRDDHAPRQDMLHIPDTGLKLNRRSRAKRLPLLTPELKSYVLFEDLTDPILGPDRGRKIHPKCKPCLPVDTLALQRELEKFSPHEPCLSELSLDKLTLREARRMSFQATGRAKYHDMMRRLYKLGDF